MNKNKAFCIVKKILAFSFVIVFVFLLNVACRNSTYTLTLDYNYLGKVEKTNVPSGLLSEPKVPERSGYEFDGWYDGNNKWNFSSDEITKNLTLTAKWKPTAYTLTLDANGGICDAENLIVYYEQAYELPVPVRDGYYFIGWFWGALRVTDLNWSWCCDNEFYAKWSVFPNAETVYFGRYEQDGNIENGFEPIEWLILDQTENEYLILSKYVIDARRFNEFDCRGNVWADSSIRLWLNDSFYHNAFSEEEKKSIIQKYLTDVDTSDKIFLLSFDEMNLFLYENLFYGYCTNYAIGNGVYLGCESDNGWGAWWWLRGGSEKVDRYHNNFIQGGAPGSYSEDTDGCGFSGVRPALGVSKNSVIIKNN